MDFSGDIQNFQRYGTYTYEPDSVGNFIFDSSSVDFAEVYFAFPLKNIVYNNIKIQSFYDPTFTEFMPGSQSFDTQQVDQTNDIQQQIGVLTEENTSLKSQLDSLTAQSNSDSTAANQQATKQVIFELRKALGQGRVDSDFSEDFPYSPIKKAVTVNTGSIV